MRLTTRLALLPLAILTASCASTNTTPNVGARDRILVEGRDGDLVHQVTDAGTHATFAATPAKLWPMVQAVYADLGIQANNSDQAAGRYGALNFAFPKRLNNVGVGNYFSCGSNITGAVVDQGRVNADIITTLKALPDGQTDALVFVTGMVTRNEGTSGNTMPCNSTGRLEELIKRSIQSRLGR